MGISYGSTKSAVASNRAVVWSLIAWKSIRRPSIGLDLKSVFVFQNCVFLFNTIPGLLVSNCVEDRLCIGSEVGIGWDKFLIGCILPGVALTENHDVVSLSEGVREVSTWLQDYLRVFSGGHITG